MVCRALAATSTPQHFDLPAGDAANALRLAAQQAGREIMFPAEVVQGVRVAAVTGNFTVEEAVTRMLGGTELHLVRDAGSSALAVGRTTVSSTPRTTAARGSAEAASETPDTVTLNPFVVSETDASGYSANSTLAGTRLNTALRDVGASISIITAEFLADTASTNLGELLALTTATEVGGVFGNFAGGAEAFGRPDQSEARENPEGNQRVRGIGPASTTRDFFLSDIPMDSYNTSRVTINRGPNSLLFGIGNPAGTIDTSLRKAQLGRNSNEVTARYGSNRSYRSSLDVNRVLLPDRLAFRLDTVSEQNNFDQKPAFDRKGRLYGTVEAVLRDGKKSLIAGKTSVRVSGEAGDSQSTPVNVIPPTNAYSIFFQPPDAALDSIPGVDLSPTVLKGSPGYIWAPRVTVDNRGNSAGIPQNNGAYYFVPWFIHIPLVFDTPGQREPGYLNGNNPALGGIAGVMGRIRYATNPNNRPAIDAISTTSSYNLIPGFTTPVLQNRDVFDYRSRLISGSSNRIAQRFTAANAAITQELFDGRGGLELAIDKQTSRSFRALPFSQGQNGSANGLSDIYIDVSRYLSNDQPNPDLGRPFMQQLGIQDRNTLRERESFRATGFYKLNFDDRRKTLFGLPLGNHTLSGLFNTQTIDARTESFQSAWESSTRDLNTTVFQESIATVYRRSPVLVQYLGPSVLNANSADDLRITDVFNGRIPANGDVQNVTFFDFITKQLVTEKLAIHRYLYGGSLSRQTIASKSLSAKSDFFQDTLVTVVGWRWDRLRTYANEANRRLADGTIDPNFRLGDAANLDESGRNFTWSAVGRYPRRFLPKLPDGLDLSAYYNQSGNFNPVSPRANLNGAIIPTPAGTTKEYGLLAEVLDRRASLRLNWFHTLQTNTSNNAQGATTQVYNFPSGVLIGGYRSAETQGIPFASIPGVTAAGYSSYQQLYAAALKVLPEPTNTLKNMRFNAAGALLSDALPGLTDTSNLEARGFEAELVGQLTKRLRVSFNVAEQETVVNGSARLTKQVADALYTNLAKANLLNIADSPALPPALTIGQRYNFLINNPLAATVARDGAVSQEQRKWRANFVATHDFRGVENSVLNKMSVGTAVRWQSKIAIGNPFLTGERLKQKIVATSTSFKSTAEIKDTDPVMQSQFPDIANPFYGPEELTGDFWIGYRRRITKGIDWRLQLNVRNAWGNSHDMPVKANPDGTIAVIRIPNETRWYLSNTFTF